jgi:hypothetical protein
VKSWKIAGKWPTKPIFRFTVSRLEDGSPADDRSAPSKAVTVKDAISDLVSDSI